jgi:hypothetical protein
MAFDAERLIAIEAKYGTKHKVERRVTSPYYKGKNLYNTHQGGDKMHHHGYAEDYARVLPEDPKVVVEMGILTGVGLATLSHLYPDADLYGLDIDLSHYSQACSSLLQRGAFRRKLPELVAFDELCGKDWQELEDILPRSSVDLWIDDAIHDTDVIIRAFKSARKFMAPGGVYIIEDNDEVADALALMYPDREIYSRGRFTAIYL